MAEKVLLLITLAVLAREDIRTRRIDLRIIWLSGAVEVGLLMIHQDYSWVESLSGIAVGGGLMLVSLISKERIGQGDAWLVMLCGLYLGLWGNLFLLFVASLLAAITGGVAIWRGKMERTVGMPFGAFLLAADMVWLTMG